MFKRPILIALIAGLVYLNYTTPKIEEHKALLLAQLQQGYPIPENLQQAIWKDIDFSNFMVCSFMKTREDSKLISTGYLKNVKLVDTEWVQEMRLKLQRQTVN